MLDAAQEGKRIDLSGLFDSSPADGIGVSSQPAVNVASVAQRSPLRYPGGKTWLIPHIRT